MADGPQWIETLRREQGVRDGVVLYGNTRDLFAVPGDTRYRTLPRLLMETVGAEAQGSARLRATWDRVDGLRFGSDAEARRWHEAVQRHTVGGAGEGDAYDLGEDFEEEEPASDGVRIELEELLAQYRQVLAEPHLQPVLVLDWSHLLVTQPAHPDPAERGWLLQLGKALVGEPLQRVDSDSLRRGRGLLVLVSASLGAVPPVLWQGEPRVRAIAVPRPGRAERRDFFLRHRDDLRIERPRPAPGSDAPVGTQAAVEALADLSDGLCTVDCRQLLALSRAVAEPLSPSHLLNLYRLGDQRSPWEELSEERLERVEQELMDRVVGQDRAVQDVATTVIRAWLGLAGLQHSARRSKPKGTLFFVGPTGVGKTELAKALAQFLFGDESACIRFDMSEFNHEHSDQRLVGAPPGYVGFEDGGQLTNAVAERPFSVLLFDEIEKAHHRVLDKFLQILEDGRLTDGRGETATFSEAVIIFTSNLGAADCPESGAGHAALERHFLGAVEQHFTKVLGRPELLNRLGDNIVVFHPIVDDDFRLAILERKLQPLRDHLHERWGMTLELEDGVARALMAGARADHGGRGLINAVERSLFNPLTRFLFSRRHQLRQGRRVVVTHDGAALDFALEDGECC
jgi:hypothetical protein